MRTSLSYFIYRTNAVIALSFYLLVALGPSAFGVADLAEQHTAPGLLQHSDLKHKVHASLPYMCDGL